MNLHDRVVDAALKTAELAWANREALAFHLDHQPALKHNETLVALHVLVRNFANSNPAFIGEVVPNLKAFI